MTELTSKLAGAIAAAYDFSAMRTVVEVGGGWGALLPPILQAHPQLRGTVFDLPHARDGAQRPFEKTGIAERCEFVDGSFFETVPAGADTYLLRA